MWKLASANKRNAALILSGPKKKKNKKKKSRRSCDQNEITIIARRSTNLRLFLRNTVFLFFFLPVADTRIKRQENDATMLSRYVQKTSKINYKKPAKSGMTNGGNGPG